MKKIKKKNNEILSYNNENKVLINLFRNLYDKKLISDIIQIKRAAQNEKDKDVIAYKLVINKGFLGSQYSSINNSNWISAWHGTNY